MYPNDTHTCDEVVVFYAFRLPNEICIKIHENTILSICLELQTTYSQKGIATFIMINGP